MAKRTPEKDHRDFLLQVYCGLVLRGFDRERDIPDPILRKCWRLGKRALRIEQSQANRAGVGK